MTFEIKKSIKVGIKIYDTEYEVVKPTVGEIRAMDKEVKALPDSDEDGKFDLMLEFIANRGVPREVCEKLEADHFTQLVEYLTGKKT